MSPTCTCFSCKRSSTKPQCACAAKSGSDPNKDSVFNRQQTPQTPNGRAAFTLTQCVLVYFHRYVRIPSDPERLVIKSGRVVCRHSSTTDSDVTAREPETRPGDDVTISSGHVRKISVSTAEEGRLHSQSSLDFDTGSDAEFVPSAERSQQFRSEEGDYQFSETQTTVHRTHRTSGGNAPQHLRHPQDEGITPVDSVFESVQPVSHVESERTESIQRISQSRTIQIRDTHTSHQTDTRAVESIFEAVLPTRSTQGPDTQQEAGRHPEAVESDTQPEPERHPGAVASVFEAVQSQPPALSSTLSSSHSSSLYMSPASSSQLYQTASGTPTSEIEYR